MYLLKIIKTKHQLTKILLKEGLTRSQAKEMTKAAHVENVKIPKYIQTISNLKHKLEVYLGNLTYSPNRKTIQAHIWYLNHFCNPADIKNQKYIPSKFRK